MAKQRVRLTDENDPLTSTESVFATFEQVSRVASQQAENITIQESEKVAIQEADNIALDIAEKVVSQQAENITIQEAVNTALSIAEKVASQEVKKMALRKSTFQLSEEILKQLDIYHLQLQLQMGKAVAPYKEVIVEEAISQFLVNIDIKSFERLLNRQKTR